jgi:hypothetical protein
MRPSNLGNTHDPRLPTRPPPCAQIYNFLSPRDVSQFLAEVSDVFDNFPPVPAQIEFDTLTPR